MSRSADSTEADSTEAEVLDFLVSLGADEDQLLECERCGSVHGLAADLVLTQGSHLTAGDLAKRTTSTEAEVLALWRALGVEVDPGATRFSERDAALTEFLLSGHSVHKGNELLRVIGEALSRVADAALAMYLQTIESNLVERGASELATAQVSAHAASLALRIGDGLGAVFRHQLLDAIERQRLAQSEVSDRSLFRLVVGFVDLVGFTPLSLRLEPGQLRAFVSRFESEAFELATMLGGRIIKHIGDEIMFIAMDPEVGCRLAIALMDKLGDDVIRPRGGLCFGEVLTRHGDYYGPVVNVASRITDEAIPGELLVDSSIVEWVSDSSISFEPAGRRQLKGFDEPVMVHSLIR